MRSTMWCCLLLEKHSFDQMLGALPPRARAYVCSARTWKTVQTNPVTATTADFAEKTCHRRIPEIMRRLASDRGRDSVVATDKNQISMALSLPLGLAAV